MDWLPHVVIKAEMMLVQDGHYRIKNSTCWFPDQTTSRFILSVKILHHKNMSNNYVRLVDIS